MTGTNDYYAAFSAAFVTLAIIAMTTALGQQLATGLLPPIL